MTIYYVVHLDTGLVVKSVSYQSAVKYAVECGGVIINGRCQFAQLIVAKCRALWNK